MLHDSHQLYAIVAWNSIEASLYTFQLNVYALMAHTDIELSKYTLKHIFSKNNQQIHSLKYTYACVCVREFLLLHLTSVVMCNGHYY